MQQRKTQIYIVRLWKETNNRQPWRGSIQNIRTGQSVSASNLNELADFIRRCFDQEMKIQPKQERGLK